jgi:hypothetical protein
MAQREDTWVLPYSVDSGISSDMYPLEPDRQYILY